MSEKIDLLRRKLLIMLQDYTGIEPLKINLEKIKRIVNYEYYIR